MAAAARESGRTSAPRLLLLLLVTLLWATAKVRSVPEEDLSHRNKEPPAPLQQLQPQPAAVQVPEPARAEVSRTGRGGRGCGAGCAGYQAHSRPERRPQLRAAGVGEGSPAPLVERKIVEGSFSGVRPGVSSLFMGEENPGVGKGNPSSQPTAIP